MYSIPVILIIVYLLGFVWLIIDTGKGNKDGRNKRR